MRMFNYFGLWSLRGWDKYKIQIKKEYPGGGIYNEQAAAFPGQAGVGLC
jgi:hypothetical protein